MGISRGQLELAIAPERRPGDKLRLSTRELGVRRNMVGVISDHFIDGAFQRFERNTGARRGADTELAGITSIAVVACRNVGRQPPFHHQTTVQRRGRIAAEQMRKYLQRFGFAGCPFGIAFDAVKPQEQRDLGILTVYRDAAFTHAVRLGVIDARDQFTCRHRTEFGFGDLAHLLRRHVPRHDQDGVVGCVMAAIEIVSLGTADAADLIRPADHRAAVGMGQIERGFGLLQHQGLRIAVDSQSPFLGHDVALGHHRAFGEVEPTHPVGFEMRDQPQLVLGDLLVENGEVVGGEGVLVAAVAGDGLREAAAGNGPRAAEHHVLEEMGEPRNPGRIVHRANLIDHQLGDHRRTVIWHHHHLQPVLQHKLECFAGGRRLGRRTLRKRRRTGDKQRNQRRPNAPPNARNFRRGAPHG